MIENTKCTNVMSGHILHESVMVRNHESGFFFRSLFAFVFLNPVFSILMVLSCVFPMGFSTKGVCL